MESVRYHFHAQISSSYKLHSFNGNFCFHHRSFIARCFFFFFVLLTDEFFFFGCVSVSVFVKALWKEKTEKTNASWNGDLIAYFASHNNDILALSFSKSFFYSQPSTVSFSLFFVLVKCHPFSSHCLSLSLTHSVCVSVCKLSVF